MQEQETSRSENNSLARDPLQRTWAAQVSEPQLRPYPNLVFLVSFFSVFSVVSVVLREEMHGA